MCPSNDVQQNGFYQNLKQHQHSKIEKDLARWVLWTNQCVTAGVSAGSFFSSLRQVL